MTVNYTSWLLDDRVQVISVLTFIFLIFKHVISGAVHSSLSSANLQDLAKSQGKTIEEMNHWLRMNRDLERSRVKHTRMLESTWNLCLLGAVVAANAWGDGSGLGKTVAFMIHAHFLCVHVLSVRSVPTRSEFLVVLFELMVRLGLAAVPPSEFVRVVVLTHDAVDAVFEVSKLASLVGFHAVGKGVFAVFTGVWFYVRTVRFPLFAWENQHLLDSQDENVAVALRALVGAQLAFDVYGFYFIFFTAKNAFWTGAGAAKRLIRADSVSSISTQEYDTDSSLSSNLREDPDD